MGGDIVYIVSKNAVLAGPHNVGYGAAKADQAHQVRLLAAELGEQGIRVNGVSPDGVVRGSADACGLPVIAGPVEATALGNALIQARALGAVGGSMADLRRLLRETPQRRRYEPGTDQRAWHSAENRLTPEGVPPPARPPGSGTAVGAPPAGADSSGAGRHSVLHIAHTSPASGLHAAGVSWGAGRAATCAAGCAVPVIGRWCPRCL